MINVILNRAQGLLRGAVPPQSTEQKKRIVRYGLNELAKSGYVASHHAGVYSNYMPVYEEMANEDDLLIRLHAFVAARNENLETSREWIERGPTTDPTSFLQVRGFKAYYDASLGSRGAMLLEDYSDQPRYRGVSGMEYGFDSTLVKEILNAGFQLAIHCIGDKGNRDILDFYEKAFTENPKAKKLRNRIEHAQIVHPDDFKRFRELNIIASMEPAHAVEDMPWAVARVGTNRIKGGYAWRTFRQNGVTVIFNSDFSGTDHSFFYGMYCATTRKKKNDDQPWQADQVFTIEESIRAYTIWAAYASSQENFTGTIEKGKWADLTFMDIDLLNTRDQLKIMEGKILRTIVNGKTVYRL